MRAPLPDAPQRRLSHDGDILTDAIGVEGRLNEASLPAVQCASGRDQTLTQKCLSLVEHASLVEVGPVRDQQLPHQRWTGHGVHRAAAKVDAYQVAVSAK